MANENSVLLDAYGITDQETGQGYAFRDLVIENLLNDGFGTEEGIGGLRVYDGTIEQNVNGTWVPITSGGTSIRLADVSGATLNATGATIRLNWTDPDDVEISGVKLAEWAGTTVVRKVGSAPTSRSDGTVVVNSTTKNAYASTAFVDSGLEFGVTYYYRFFPYTTGNLYTLGTSLNVTPARIQIENTPVQSGTLTYTGSPQTATFNYEDSTKMTVTNKSGTSAGHYYAYATPISSDYAWSDEQKVTITESIDGTQTRSFEHDGVDSLDFDLSSISDNDTHTGTISVSDGTNTDTITFTFKKGA